MMDTVTSTTTFQPIQSDGYLLSSLGKDAPKIEITETDSLCQGPLSPAGCDVPLCQCRDDLHHHGDNPVIPDCRADSQHESSQHRRGSLSRRSEGGPGKCPSPSRNSPRRHSPVPYSPKRQTRTRSSASSAASEEFADVCLSPRRRSPSGGAERPSSLSLAASGSSGEEFICISYADPFSSPTIAHTSDGILAISISCTHDSVGGGGGGNQDVEMTSQDIRREEPGSDTDVPPSSDSCSAARTSVAADATPSLGEEDGFRGCSQSSVFENQAEKRRDLSGLSSTRAGNQQESCCSAFMDSADTAGEGDGAGVGSGSPHPDITCRPGTRVAESAPLSCSPRGGGEECMVGVEAMEGEDDFHATDSESSSDDDMADFVSPPIPYGVAMSLDCYSSNGYVTSQFPSADPVASDPQCSSGLARCAQNQGHDPTCSSRDQGSYQYDQPGDTEQASPASPGTSAARGTSQSAAADGDRSAGSVDPARGLPVCGDVSHVAGCVPGWAARRASCPDRGLCPSPSSPCPQEAAPGRRLSQHVSKTPEDFALSCVVGSPPLTFPHCRHAVLVHCSLPSPYDPDLPTPPIVLTPHISYQDLNVDPTVTPDTRFAQGGGGVARNVRTFSKGTPTGGEDSSDTPLQHRPDISRSRSFPKLDQTDGHFREPDQPWPVLGEGAGGDDVTGVGGHPSPSHSESNRRQWDSRRSSDSECRGGEVSDMVGLPQGGTSVSLPGSPSSSRAAVIGRLRRVVERRLSSGNTDTMEAAFHQ